MKEIIGKEIRRARKLKKIRVNALAEMVGIDASYMSRIELGRVLPRVEIQEKIFEALGVEMIVLLRDKE